MFYKRFNKMMNSALNKNDMIVILDTLYKNLFVFSVITCLNLALKEGKEIQRCTPLFL